MNADTFLQQRKDRVDLRQFFVFIREKINGIVEHFFDEMFLILCRELLNVSEAEKHRLQSLRTRIEVEFRRCTCVGLAILFAETEDDHRSQVSFHDHLDNFEDIGFR